MRAHLLILVFLTALQTQGYARTCLEEITAVYARTDENPVETPDKEKDIPDENGDDDERVPSKEPAPDPQPEPEPVPTPDPEPVPRPDPAPIQIPDEPYRRRSNLPNQSPPIMPDPNRRKQYIPYAPTCPPCPPCPPGCP